MSFGKTIELADGQKIQAPEIRLPRAGVLVGRVVDEFGEVAIRVCDGRSRTIPTLRTRAGEYCLVAEPQNFSPPGEAVRTFRRTCHPR